jgi:hypothetical protein
LDAFFRLLPERAEGERSWTVTREVAEALAALRRMA